MNQYTIYCTPEQTRKALKLGAPIETYKPIIIDSKAGGSFTTPTMEIVTAEQMIGWLEVQKYISSIEVSHQYRINKYCYYIFDDYGNDIESLDSKIRFNSRPEATLAAIDAALDYLCDKK